MDSLIDEMKYYRSDVYDYAKPDNVIGAVVRYFWATANPFRLIWWDYDE